MKFAITCRQSTILIHFNRSVPCHEAMEDFEGERSAHLLAEANPEMVKVSRAKRHPGKSRPISDLCKEYEGRLADLQNKMGWAKESCKKLGKELADLETKVAWDKGSMSTCERVDTAAQEIIADVALNKPRKQEGAAGEEAAIKGAHGSASATS